MSKIRFAIVGCGIITKTSHIPSLLGFADRASVTALYSMRKESCEECASKFPEGSHPALYFGQIGEAHEQSLGRMLARDDIDAVIVALPISLQIEIVRMALAAGKHVLSEKPISSNWDTGAAMIREYHEKYQPLGLVWSVGENYRFEPAFQRAEELVKELGTLMLAELRCHCPMPRDNVFSQTPWRQNPDYVGGFLLDGGVHFIAALRKVCSPSAEIKEAMGFSGAYNLDVPAPDSLVASVRWGGGLVGTIAISYAVYDRLFELAVTGKNGRVTVARGSQEGKFGYTVTYRDVVEFFRFEGMELEVAGFIDVIKHKHVDPNSPEAALRDLEVVHAILQSSSTGQCVPCNKTI